MALLNSVETEDRVCALQIVLIKTQYFYPEDRVCVLNL